MESVEKLTLEETPKQSESVGRNVMIAIGSVGLAILVIYIIVSSSIKSTDFKKMDFSAQKSEQTVAGASYGPNRPAVLPSSTKAPSVSPTLAGTATAAPTTAPTSAPAATATNTPAPTVTNTPSPTLTPTDGPTATPTDTTPTPTNTP